MSDKKVTYEKEFKKVIRYMQVEFGWAHLEVLPITFQKLINDVIKATKQVNKLL